MRDFHKQLDNRMFDFPQFYLNMAQSLPDECVIAEVGVAEGASAIFLAEALLNFKKKFTFYLVDDLSYGRDVQLRALLKNICQANLGHLVEIVPVSSVEAACRFPDCHFDFVFIDASHKIEWTKADILLWYQKVKEGGILAGHDYNLQEGSEVQMAVDFMIPSSVIVDMKVFRPLEIIRTDKGLNIWKVKKRFYVKMQT